MKRITKRDADPANTQAVSPRQRSERLETGALDAEVDQVFGEAERPTERDRIAHLREFGARIKRGRLQ